MTQYSTIHNAVRQAFCSEIKPEDLVRPDLYDSAARCVATRAACALVEDGQCDAGQAPCA